MLPGVNIIDTEAEVFNSIWPNGYVESFADYAGCPKCLRDEIAEVGIKPHYNNEHVAAEIGCGGGLWLKRCLLANFKHVFAVDVVPIKFDTSATNFTYVQVPSKNFECPGIADGTLDFVFTFGLFCHLSLAAQRQYLKALFRKLKSGGSMVAMFADFRRHPYFSKLPEKTLDKYKEKNTSPQDGAWFYNDLETTRKMVEESGFIDFTDLLPGFRDTFARFKKPLSHA
jgi:hypothetical protein